MIVNREQKQEFISSLNGLLQDQKFVVVAHYKGLSVKQMEDLRGKAREVGVGFRVTKNRLTRLALAGTSFEGLSDLFNGPTAIAYAADPVATAKVCANFAKENEDLFVLGGSLEGELMDVATVKALAKLPSLDESRAKIVGIITTPATRIASVIQAPAGQLARVISAKAQQDEAA
jgi:large subunit ribosomal protein L10